MIRHPLDDSAQPAGALYFRTPVTPEEAFQAIGRLRKEARDEIERLIDWLDSTDDHMEREPNGDEEDASYAEGRSQLCAHNEDDEDTGDDEPSLGSSGHGSGNSIDYTHTSISDGFQMVQDCEGDEHDGAEPENEHGDGDPDDEPSLGWTVDGALGNPTAVCDRELSEPCRRPQHRTTIDRTPLTVEVSYRRFLRGLTPEQRKAMQDRTNPDSGVSLVGGPAWGEQ